jgi:hypothetical protein
MATADRSRRPTEHAKGGTGDAAGDCSTECSPLPTIATCSTAKPWSDSQLTARSASA